MKLAVPAADLLVAPHDLARHLVERARQLADLVVAVHLRGLGTAEPERLHAFAQPVDRLGDATGEEHAERQHEEQRDRDPEERVLPHHRRRAQRHLGALGDHHHPPEGTDGRGAGQPAFAVGSDDHAGRGSAGEEIALVRRQLDVIRLGEDGAAARGDVCEGATL